MLNRTLVAVFTSILCLTNITFAAQVSAPFMSGRSNTIKGDHHKGIGVTPSTIFNFITDAGATCNGVVDDAPALANAGALMRAAQAASPGTAVTLFVPSGSNCKWASCPIASDGQQRPFANLTNFTFIATGATINVAPGCTVYSGTAILGSDGVGPVTQKQFLTNSVSDTCVTMVTPGDETNYPVGRQVLVAGEGMQVNSFPPNYSLWEYAQVASRPAGQVCFTAGLKNAYPNSTVVIDLLTGGANCSNVTCGGQGTLILMSPTWGTTFHFIGGNWNSTNEIEFSAQTVIIDNMTVTSGGVNQNCYLASLSQNVTFNNVNWNGVGTCRSEMDKEVDQIIVNGGTLNGNFQSQSINTLILNNGATYGGPSFPLHTICNNSTINTGGAMKFGNAFGSLPVTFAGTNCNMPNPISPDPAFFNGFSYPGGYDGAGHFAFGSDIYAGLPQWTSRNGVLTTQADGTAGRCNYRDCGFHFTITGSQYVPLISTTGTMTVNTNNTLTATSPPPGINQVAAAFTFPAITCTGCFGNQQALDMNFAGAQNKPAFTYSNRTYTCANNIANVAGSLDINTAQGFTSTGNFTSVKLNVTVADTNGSDVGPLFVTKPRTILDTTTGLESSPAFASIDLSQTGLRTITQTGTSGAVGIDVLTAPGANKRMTGDIVSISAGGGGVTNGPAAQCPVINAEWVMND